MNVNASQAAQPPKPLPVGHYPFGVDTPAPRLAGFPAGTARIRQRNDAFPIVYIRTATGIRAFHVEGWSDGTWRPLAEIGSNERRPAAKPDRPEYLPPLSLADAEHLWQRSDYGQDAVEMPGSKINSADAAAFFQEGYNYARRRLRGET